MNRKALTKKIKNKRSVFKRIGQFCLIALLCLGCLVSPFLTQTVITPSAEGGVLDSPPTSTPRTTVSIEWHSNVAAEVKKEDSSGNKYTYLAATTNSYRTLCVYAKGVPNTTVKVQVFSFDVSAVAENGDYSEVNAWTNITTDGGGNGSATISIAPSSQKRFADEGTNTAGKSAVAASIGSTVYTRIYGLRIGSVSTNASIDGEKNTVYARTGYNTTSIPTENGSTGAYELIKNNDSTLTNNGVIMKSSVSNGYTYTTVLTSGSSVTYDSKKSGKTSIAGEGSDSWTFYPSKALSTTANAYRQYFSDTELYYSGNMTVSDTSISKRAGFTLTFTGTATSGQVKVGGPGDANGNNVELNWDDHYVRWLNRENFINKGQKLANVHEGALTPISNRGKGYNYFSKCYYDGSITMKMKLRGYGKDVYNPTLSVILVNDDAPVIKDVSVWDGGDYGYREGDDLKVAVRFSKPVRLSKTTLGGWESLALKAKAGEKNLTLNYETGSYTDTLIFSTKLSKDIVCDQLEIGDFVAAKGAYVGDMMCNVDNGNNLADLTNWQGNSKTLSCKIDSRTPVITVSNIPSTTKRTHTVNVTVENVSESGKLYYIWTTEPDLRKVADSSWHLLPNFKVGTNQIPSGNENGLVYLHMRLVAPSGIVIEKFGGLYQFDNTPPTVDTSAEVEYALYKQEHILKMHANDVGIGNGIDAGVGSIDLTIERRGADNNFTTVEGYPKRVYPQEGSSSLYMTQDANDSTLYTMSLKMSDVGLEENAWAEYRVGYTVTDKLGNVATVALDDGTPSTVFYDNRSLFFDSRTTFQVDIYESAGKDAGKLVSDLNFDSLPVFFNEVPTKSGGDDYVPLSISVCSVNEGEIAEGDKFYLQTIQLDDKVVYSATWDGDNDSYVGVWANGKSYDDYGFLDNPAENVTPSKNEDLPALGGGGLGKRELQGNVTFNDRACGYYKFIYQKQGSNTQSSTVSMYVSPRETTPKNYSTLYAPDRLLVNQVWKISTSNFYSQTTDPVESPYAKTSSAPIFSSRTKAQEFVRFKEYQDIYIKNLTADEALVLKSGQQDNLRMADEYYQGTQSTTPQQGQTWVRYKSKSWTVGNTAVNKWVYYFISTSSLSKIEEADVLANTYLAAAISDNVEDIVGTEPTDLTPTTNYTLTVQNKALSNGEPFYPPEALYYSSITVGSENCAFASGIRYEGDPDLYDSFIDYEISGHTEKVPLVSHYTFSLTGGYQLAYYRSITNDKWVKISEGATLKNTVKGTGLYEIAEMNGGYKSYYVYCDFSAPVLQYDAKKGENDINDARFSSASHDPTWSSTITAAQITLDIFSSEEVDKYAYVYFEKADVMAVGENEMFLSAYELSQMGGYALPKGTYKMYVYDRLGNCIMTKVRTNPTPIVEEEPYVEKDKNGDDIAVHFFINRERNEIQTLEIRRDGALVAQFDSNDPTTYAKEFSFSKSGKYSCFIEDIYGNTFELQEELELVRKPPEVSFAYQDPTSSTTRYINMTVSKEGEQVAQGSANVREVYVEGRLYPTYHITTTTTIRLTTTASSRTKFTYSIEPADVEVTEGSNEYGRKTFILPYDQGPWTFRLNYLDDETDRSALVITCMRDSEPPTVSATVEVPVYEYFDRIDDGNGNDVLGNVLFDTSKPPEIRSDVINNGDRASGDSLTFKWEDDAGVIAVHYTLNGGNPITLDSWLEEWTTTEVGKYVFTVMDLLGNTTTFETELTNALNYYVEMGEKRAVYYGDPENYITGVGLNAVWSKSEYTGKEIRIHMQETMILMLLYEANGKKVMYHLDYYGNVLVVLEEVPSGGNQSEAITVDIVEGASGTLLTDGTLVLNYEVKNGALIITSPEPTLQEFWQLRFTNRASNSNPSIVQIERSNAYPEILLFYERGDEQRQLQVNDKTYVGINTTVQLGGVTGQALMDVKQVIAYRSDEEFYDYTGIADQTPLKTGNTLGSISEDGYYIIVAINKYDNEQVMLVRINSTIAIEVRVAYESHDIPERVFSDLTVQDEPYYFYSNKEIYLNVWNSEMEVGVIEGDVTLLSSQWDGYRKFSVKQTGSFTLKVSDACQNEYILQCEIVAPSPLEYEDYLVGFNEKAVRKEENYTNAPLSLSLENMQSGGVAYAAYRKVGEKQWLSLYDDVSQYKLNADGSNFAECVGTSNGSYEILFTDKYGNEWIERVHISDLSQITLQRKIQASLGEESVNLSNALQQGVWSNYIVVMKNTAEQYLLTVNGQQVHFNASGSYQWELPLTVAEGEEVYAVVYIDEYGNEYCLDVHLYRKVPTVQADMDSKPISSGGNLYVRGDVAYTWEGDSITASYARDSESDVPYLKGQLLTEDGAYVITFVDRAGNKTTAHITKDTTVSCFLTSGGQEIPYGITVNGGVRIGTRETEVVISSMTKDGENYAAELNDTFTENGSYVVVLVDKIGNKTELIFEIISRPSQSFLYQANKDFVISQIWMESGDVRLPYVSDVTVSQDGRQQYQFNVDGKYEVELFHVPSNTYSSFSITIDNVAPTATLVGATEGQATRANVSLSGLQEGDVVDVYQDGVLVQTYNYRRGQKFPEIATAGMYKVVVRDQAGNQTVYEFEREFTTNVASNLMICFALVGIAILGIVFVRGRERVRTK